MALKTYGYCIGICAGLLAAAASAQDTHTIGVTISDSDTGTADLFVEDVSVLDGKTCIGNGCLTSEGFTNGTVLKLKSSSNWIDIIDTSGAGVPQSDWRLKFNDSSTAEEKFAINDLTTGTIPFTISGGAPDNALFMDSAGKIGLGTSFPQGNLHVVTGILPTLRLEQNSSGGLTPGAWQFVVTSTGALHVTDPINARYPLRVQTGSTGDQQVVFASNGNVALANSYVAVPDSRLHLRFDDGSAQFKVEEASATQTARVLMSLQNNGRPDIVMGNTATGDEWSFGAGTNFVLKQGAVGTDPAAKTKLFEIGPAGDATLTGTLTTGGTTCGGGCDRVFSEGYDLPSITEHAQAMFALGHLPNVGPTVEGAPFNVTDKLGRMLNELEYAHIYIAQQEETIAMLKQQHAAHIAAQDKRIARLEAMIVERPTGD